MYTPKELQPLTLREVEVVYKPKHHPLKNFQVEGSEIAAQLFYDNWDHNTLNYREEARVIPLTTRNTPLGVHLLSIGTAIGTLINPKELITSVLLSGGTGFLVAHNHPSGNLKPSDQDIRLNRVLEDAADLMGLRMVDNLIITDIGYYSITGDQKGILPSKLDEPGTSNLEF